MKILFDHQIFSTQNYGGISRYYAELIKGMEESKLHTALISKVYTDNSYVKEFDFSKLPMISKVSFYKKNELLYYINQLASIRSITRENYDLFHCTYYNSYFLKYVKTPFIVTFHDMIHEKLGGLYPALYDESTYRRKKELAKKASRIIAVSENTKKDIVEILQIDPSKIDVVYHGSSIPQQTYHKMTNRNETNPYLLYVGRRERYKNFNFFLMSIHRLLTNNKVTLICAGGDDFTTDEKDLIRKLSLEMHVIQRNVDDVTLKSLYQGALAFTFPTLYEGFGIPILEAFACNCPCLLSYNSSLPEVAGNAALYFDPRNADSISEAVERIIVSPETRHKLIMNGQNRLEQFSWEKTVHKTIKSYELSIR